jgi:XTP/dITP diphosphohydrolase
VTKVVLATRNRGKLADVRHLLAAHGLALDLVAAVDLDLPDIEETGTTFEENARLKAETTCRLTGLPAIADDSGLEVDALGGEPGVHSARYAGLPSNDERNNQKLVAALASHRARTARFRSVVAYATPGGPTLVAHGTCEGEILEAGRGTQGFGYDPLFFCPELGKTFGEATIDEKARVSHRARAMALLASEIRGTPTSINGA